MLEGVRLGSESKQTVNYDWGVKQACAVIHVSYNDDDDGTVANYVHAVCDSIVTTPTCIAVSHYMCVVTHKSISLTSLSAFVADRFIFTKTSKLYYVVCIMHYISW